MSQWCFCPTCGEPLEHTPPIKCSKCHAEHWRNPKPGASFLVRDTSNRFLLVKRRNEPHAGSWEIPGGFSNPDEHPAAAGQRELFEETSIVARPTCYLGVWMDRYTHNGVTESTQNHYYLAESFTSVVQNNETEVVASKWFAADEIPWNELAFPRQTEPALRLALSLAVNNDTRGIADVPNEVLNPDLKTATNDA